MTNIKSKTNPKYEDKKRKICVFIFPETKEAYVDKTAAKDLWRYYDNHYRERNTMTKQAFRRGKEDDLLPEFYLLEEIFGTDSQAFGRCIAWSKYFSEAGYGLLSSKMNDFINEMDAETQEIYESIRTVSMQEICSKDKNLFPKFKKKGPNKRTEKSKLKADERRITLYLKEKEYQKIKETAEQYGVTMSEYIFECVRFGGRLQLDTTFLEQYVHKLDDCQNVFTGMLTTYLLSGEYYSADILKMEEIGAEIARSNDDVKREIIRFYKHFRHLKTGKQLTADPLQ